MNYIVFDLEWNQPIEGRTEKREEIPFEIIEIGAVKLNEKKEVIGTFNRLIKPSIYKEMHYIIKDMVHLDIKDLKNEEGFRTVLRSFLDFCGEDYIFATWGDTDLLEIQRNMKFYKSKPLSDGPIPFLDVQKLFSIAFEDKKSRKTLEYAIDFLHFEKDVPFHRAYSDAYYTAKVLDAIKNPEIEEFISYDLFHPPINRKREVSINFSSYSKYISREFLDKNEGLKDSKVMSTKCFLCRCNIKRIKKWFSVSGKYYLCIAKCQTHGYMKGKLRIKKSQNNKIFFVKTMKFISPEQAAELIEKKKNSEMEMREKNRYRKGL